MENQVNPSPEKQEGYEVRQFSQVPTGVFFYIGDGLYIKNDVLMKVMHYKYGSSTARYKSVQEKYDDDTQVRVLTSEPEEYTDPKDNQIIEEKFDNGGIEL